MAESTLLVDDLLKYDRVLLEATLEVANGGFLQPTGFPDIGPCLYVDGQGARRCLVESEQSMANRLEAVCMEAPGVWREPLRGKLPLIRVKDAKTDRLLATNITEAHRVASSYVLEGVLQKDAKAKKAAKETADAKDTLGTRIAKKLSIGDGPWPLDGRENLSRLVFALDPAAILHGFQFMQWETVGLRQARIIHARLEATVPDEPEVHYGLVKVDGIEPGSSAAKKSNKGQSIGHKMRLVPKQITATFELDVLALRERSLVAKKEKNAEGKETEVDDAAASLEARRFLLALALWKIHRFLTDAPAFDPRTGDVTGALRLRADCALRRSSLKWKGAKDGTGFSNESPLDIERLIGKSKDDQGQMPPLLVAPPDFTKLMKSALDLDKLDIEVKYERKAKAAPAQPADQQPAGDDAPEASEADGNGDSE